MTNPTSSHRKIPRGCQRNVLHDDENLAYRKHYYVYVVLSIRHLEFISIDDHWAYNFKCFCGKHAYSQWKVVKSSDEGIYPSRCLLLF